MRFATGPEIFLCDLYIQVDCGVHATSYKMGNFSGTLSSGTNRPGHEAYPSSAHSAEG